MTLLIRCSPSVTQDPPATTPFQFRDATYGKRTRRRGAPHLCPAYACCKRRLRVWEPADEDVLESRSAQATNSALVLNARRADVRHPCGFCILATRSFCGSFVTAPARTAY